MNLTIPKVVLSHLVKLKQCIVNEREWRLGDDTEEELYEYKNLGVLKNYIGSFCYNVTDNIEKTRKKAGMIFSSSFDRRKTNPLIFVKFWRQACLPSLLFGSELFSLTPSLLLKLERCQLWFSISRRLQQCFAHSTRSEDFRLEFD